MLATLAFWRLTGRMNKDQTMRAAILTASVIGIAVYAAVSTALATPSPSLTMK